MSELTLVLPLRGRPVFTRRWLEFAASERLPFPVLIADGSAEADAAEHRRMAEEHRELVEYRRYPEDRGLPEFFAKLADALAQVRTPYAALVDNDDFPVAAGLSRCVSVLEREPAWRACGGLVAGMTLVDGGAPRFEPRRASGDLAGATAADRLRAHFASYQVTWYDPTRAADAAAVFAEVARRDLRDVFLAELLASHLLAARGPLRKLPDLMLVRQYDAAGSAASTLRSGGALSRMLAPTWSEDFGRFTESLAAALGGGDESRALVREGYQAYLEKGLRRPAGAPAGPVRRLLSSGLRKTPLGRLKDSRWAGPEGAAALSRIAAFLSARSRA